jgi:hypothetical protein
LLVLDNFEHLLNGVDLLTEILNGAPAVSLLITSRNGSTWRKSGSFRYVG